MKYILALILGIMIVGSVFAGEPVLMVEWVGEQTTDYTQDANCMGAWLMNSTSTTELDRSNSGEDLTYISTPDSSSSVPSSYTGKSLDFELSSSESLEAADGGSTDIYGPDQHISIACWINGETLAGANRHIVSKFEYPGKVQYLLAYEDPTSSIHFSLSATGADSVHAIGATTILTGTWYHIVAVYNDVDIKIYINGSLDSNDDDNPKTYSDGIVNETGEFNISGLRWTGSLEGEFDGLIDEVIIFDRALSAAEVLDIYTNGIDGSKGEND